ncbi:MAG: hypothetical protein K8I82_16565 [Anaerolineae bacterium]|nr:hypothetical protein [Anaerolineae bacterium]
MAIITLCMMSWVAVVAQSEFETIEIPQDFFGYRDISWSSDSTRFSFFSMTGISRQEDDVLDGVDITVDAWREYDLTTGQLSSQNRWALQPDLTEAQMNAWQPHGFIYTSPSGNLGLLSRSDDNHIWVVNFQTGQTADMNQRSLIASNEPDILAVRWSSDSQAFVIMNPAFSTTSKIIYGYLPNPEDLHSLEIYPFDTVDGNPYRVSFMDGDKLLDISSSGEWVLLTAHEDVPGQAIYESGTTLMVWNPRDTSRTISWPAGSYGDLAISGAAFSPTDENSILVAHQSRGLLEYNYVTGQERVLTDTIKYYGYFSPNAHWLGFEANARFYLIDLPDLLAQK